MIGRLLNLTPYAGVKNQALPKGHESLPLKFSKNDSFNIRFGNKDSVKQEAKQFEFYPKDIYKGLKNYVIDQDEPLKTISIALHQHILRLQDSRKIKPTEEQNNISVTDNIPTSEAVSKEEISETLCKYYTFKNEEALESYTDIVSEQVNSHDLKQENTSDKIKQYLNKIFTQGEGDKIIERSEKSIELLKNRHSDEKNLTDTGYLTQLFFNSLNECIKQKQHLEATVTSIAKQSESNEVQEICPNEDVELQKSNILMIGPTGVGKTHIIRNMKNIIEQYASKGNIPFVRIDATDLTESGYQGLKVSDIARKLYEAAGRNLDKAGLGIVFLDEIDKKAKPVSTNSRDVSGEGAQNNLLPLLEDSEISFELSQGGPLLSLNTKNVLCIMGGAFLGLPEVIAARLNQNDKNSTAIGFNDPPSKTTLNKPDYLKKLTYKDLENFGFKGELLGRTPVITVLNDLDVPALTKILTEPKDAIIKEYKKIFKTGGVELEFTEEALKTIAEHAKKSGMGARALRGILNCVMKEHLFNIDNPSSEKLCIDKEQVEVALKQDQFWLNHP